MKTDSDTTKRGAQLGSSAIVRHDCAPVTITMQRRDWQMITDYFENDIEAMGEHDRSLQRRARKAQEWMQHRIAKGNVRGPRTRGAMPNTNSPS